MASQNDQPHTTIMWHWFNHETIIIYEDNSPCICTKECRCIKGNIIKYIAPKLFYGEIETLQTKSLDLQGSGGDSLWILIIQATTIIRLYNCTLFLNEFFLSRFFSYIGF